MKNLDRFDLPDTCISRAASGGAVVADEATLKLARQMPGVHKRVYYCQRCLNHGMLEPRKNHKCECVFVNCVCSKCILVEKRRVLNTQLHQLEDVQDMAHQRQIQQKNQQRHPELRQKLQNHPIETQTASKQINGPKMDRKLLNQVMKAPELIESFSRMAQHFEAADPFVGVDDDGVLNPIKGERVPNCQKCGQHGRKSRLKGHKRVCPFKDCNCPKCQVVTERQKLMADQIKIRRRQRKDTLVNMTRDKITATLNAAAAVAAAGPLPYINDLNNLSMLYNQLSQNSAIQQQQQQTTTTSAAQTAASPLLQTTFSPSGSPLLLTPPAFMPLQTSSSNYLSSNSPAGLIGAASSSQDTAASPLLSSSSEFPSLFFKANPQAAVANNSPPALSQLNAFFDQPSTTAAASVSAAAPSNESVRHTPSPCGSNSSPPSLDCCMAAPIPLNPLAGLQSSFLPSTCLKGNNLPSQEELLAFLASVQLSNCFPKLTMDPGCETLQMCPAGPQGKVATTAASFVDICSV